MITNWYIFFITRPVQFRFCRKDWVREIRTSLNRYASHLFLFRRSTWDTLRHCGRPSTDQIHQRHVTVKVTAAVTLSVTLKVSQGRSRAQSVALAVTVHVTSTSRHVVSRVTPPCRRCVRHLVTSLPPRPSIPAHFRVTSSMTSEIRGPIVDCLSWVTPVNSRGLMNRIWFIPTRPLVERLIFILCGDTRQ